MEKAKVLDVSEYQFQDLKGTPLNEATSDYEFQDINSISPRQAEEHEKTIKIERDHAVRSNFKVAPIVREHRGMIRQEETERENQIQNEVNRRLLQIEEEAYAKGFERGQQDGRDEVFRETQAATDEKIQTLSEMVNDVLRTKSEMLKNERLQVYETVKTLTKWIILRELKDDGEYVERLLEKLILEMQTKSNLLIHVNQSSFDGMSDVLEQVQNRLGELTNVRVEMDHGLDLPGLVLQSENGILNGRIGVQFKNLDKLFSNVGLPFKDDPVLDLEVPVEEKAEEVIEEIKAETSIEEVEVKATESEETLDDFSFDDIEEKKDDEEPNE